MKTALIKLSLYINYFLFAILLNSVGIVILKSQKVYGVDEVDASFIELCKDFSIAITSFLVASFLRRIGYKRAMLFALGLVLVGCLIMYSFNAFWTTKILFICIGSSFALIKMSVYSTIGLVAKGDNKAHNSLMSSVEGVFMFGVAVAYFLFPAFNDEKNESAWLNVYLLLACLSVISFLILYFSKFDIEEKTTVEDNPSVEIKNMFSLIGKRLIIVFLASAFLFVFVEQGLMTWLPTFNSRVLMLSENLSIKMASILAISLGLGRIITGWLTKVVSWFWIIATCIVVILLMIIFVLPIVVNYEFGDIVIDSFDQLSIIAFVFPLIGFFIAPIYPLLNSNVLHALPTRLHGAMSGWIILFSAIGGTTGSMITGYLFKHLGPEHTFYFTIIPLSLLMVMMIVMKIMLPKSSAQPTE